MQQKTLRYALIGGALFVWGTIMLKVFAALGDDKAIVLSSMEVAPLPTLSEQADTFSLLKQYSDPFLPDIAFIEEDSTLTEMTGTTKNIPLIPITAIPPQPEVIDISFIKYLGMVANPEKKIKTAIVSIRGKDLILKEQGSTEGVTIKKITTDKIEILYKDKKYTIAR